MTVTATNVASSGRMKRKLPSRGFADPKCLPSQNNVPNRLYLMNVTAMDIMSLGGRGLRAGDFLNERVFDELFFLIF